MTAMQRDGLRLQLADLRLMRLRTADVAANGLDPDRALRGLTGLAAEDCKALNSVGIGPLDTDAVVSDSGSPAQSSRTTAERIPTTAAFRPPNRETQP